MQYTLSYIQPENHYIAIEILVENIDAPAIDLQLPAWRPGRYELANFAKNMTRLFAFDRQGNQLQVNKLKKDRWQIQTAGNASIVVKYMYYAQQMDAGGSWMDEKQLYVNFINCMLYVEGRLFEECHVKLILLADYQIACGLEEKEKHVLYAKDYYQLVDSPMIASNALVHKTYQLAATTFHIWVQGEADSLNWPQILTDFKKFSAVQMKMMGGFPCPDYHFLLHWLPFQHYHGVEHQNSTVITLGPASQADTLYPELLGISSHELFHTWNVIRIRPAELLPYDFTRENYFTTGFVAEGITTYYGDLFLARAGVFSTEAYFAELSQTLNRHFMVANQASLSLLESSFDLWLDGYTAGAPGRKVSIYHKGALTALILDLELRQLTNDARSLDDVMRYLWQHFGPMEKGYTLVDYKKAVATVAGKDYTQYFEECIEGTSSLENRLKQALSYVGCVLQTQPNEQNPGNLIVQVVLNPNRSAEAAIHLQNWIGNKGK
ncbi:M61 family peptidase [Rhodocytophaga aerolata]|uniref:M61 family peptidase n=1 Tax=Rhodocytophaga aerolata TaxID=455078 RepID=A0ABT8R853_9BACT|nr:M61 family peptidase [Rhodocytophaga aerolata]MDO1448275.1 M61 family peptidase [Rhodocytophaga aerolata]